MSTGAIPFASPLVLPDQTSLGAVHLRVADLDRSLRFYHHAVGLPVLERDATTAVLGHDATPTVRLIARPGLLPALPNAAGLFHTAILLPDRATLGAVILRLSAHGVPLSGASDHLVSEAFYLDDPDGNGVELYRDRPREDWRWQHGQIEMASLPLDVEGVVREAGADTGVTPPGTRLGHVHLQVGDLSRAEAFYGTVIGFALTTRYGAAASFFAAGAYHHHLGLNVWRSRGAAPTPRTHAGLDAFEIIVPSDADVAAVRTRARSAGLETRASDDGLRIDDPWGVEVILRSA